LKNNYFVLITIFIKTRYEINVTIQFFKHIGTDTKMYVLYGPPYKSFQNKVVLKPILYNT